MLQIERDQLLAFGTKGLLCCTNQLVRGRVFVRSRTVLVHAREDFVRNWSLSLLM